MNIHTHCHYSTTIFHTTRHFPYCTVHEKRQKIDMYLKNANRQVKPIAVMLCVNLVTRHITDILDSVGNGTVKYSLDRLNNYYIR